EGAQLAHVPEGEALEQGAGRVADAGQVLERQRAEERELAAGQDLGHAAGLRELARETRDEPVRADADREREARARLHAALDREGRVEGRAMEPRGAGEIEIEVVDRGHLDAR